VKFYNKISCYTKISGGKNSGFSENVMNLFLRYSDYNRVKT
jgi:hypothetical protein